MTRDERSVRTSPGGALLRSSSPPPGKEVDPEGPPAGVRTMALVRWILIALMAVIAVLSVSYSFGLVSSGSASGATDVYYCPMHPQVVQDHPGECPICSMTLVKRESLAKPPPSDEPNGAKGLELENHATAGAHAGHRHTPSDPYFCPMHPEETGVDANARCPICEMKLEKRPTQALPPIPGLVPIELSLDRVQNIGVRTAPATLEGLEPELRAVGLVSVDESRLARVHTRFSGWIEQLEVATTGQKVSRGQVLAGLYNLELLPAQQEFLAARRWASGAAASAAPSGRGGESLAGDARARLELFGLSPAEIDRIAEVGQPTRTVAVTAPISGYVISKNAVLGAFVQPGTELFEIADLSKIWVLVDIYEYEVGRVSVGQAAEVSVGAFPAERFPGKVGFMYPMVDPSTRTLRVRVELDNRRMKLRPGMYAAATLRLERDRATVIPTEALVDTGEHQYVFVVQAGGRFEPRPVKAGSRADDRVQILEGLAPGEVVVTTANFFIDSESRLRAAIQGPGEPRGTPAASACDTDIDKNAFPEKHAECLACERLHRGMGTMEEDCKKAIARPWR
jgi:membrane fusion protein, copper/silver efflux system